jgi:hypothetical protein
MYLRMHGRPPQRPARRGRCRPRWPRRSDGRCAQLAPATASAAAPALQKHTMLSPLPAAHAPVCAKYTDDHNQSCACPTCSSTCKLQQHSCITILAMSCITKAHHVAVGCGPATVARSKALARLLMQRRQREVVWQRAAAGIPLPALHRTVRWAPRRPAAMAERRHIVCWVVGVQLPHGGVGCRVRLWKAGRCNPGVRSTGT